MSDEENLVRFLAAQTNIFSYALAELRAGAKRGHWMWFIFPQVSGLGQSDTARFYAIRTIDEARAYLAHPVLGERLLQCVDAVLMHRDLSPVAIFGTIDATKLKSSMTLFEAASDEPGAFGTCLDVFFAGERDERTISALMLHPLDRDRPNRAPGNGLLQIQG